MKLNWKDVLERAVATMAETAVALLPVSAAITEIDWRVIFEVSAYAGMLAVLKAFAKGCLPNAGE